jgi:hypothetical protein
MHLWLTKQINGIYDINSIIIHTLLPSLPTVENTCTLVGVFAPPEIRPDPASTR